MLVKFLDGTSREVSLEPYAILSGADLSGAILRGAGLSGAILSGADLSGAILRGAGLSGADLRNAILRGADLRNANLRGADLRNAILRGAGLRNANLSGATLRNAILRGADLRNANLRGAILSGAILSDADLRGATLSGATLSDADLSDADLSDVKGLAQFVIASEGALVGYKKLKNSVIAKLRIPRDAARVNAYGSRKCRAAYVVVLSGKGVSQRDGTTMYAPGKRVTADKFDPDPRIECGGGIHFFLTEQEAKEY